MILILSRLDFLKSEASLESVLSRESSFLFNNLVLLASCFAILWGTLFPVISEKFTGEKISVDAPFFNRINIPIAMFLLLLTGVGPLIAWRKSSFDSLRRAFLWPTVAGAIVAGGLFAIGREEFLRAGVVRTVHVRAGTRRDGVREGRERDRDQGQASFMIFGDRADASQHAPLRRIPGARRRGDHVHRIHRQGVRSATDRRDPEEATSFRSATISFGSVDIQQGQNDNYRWQKILVDVTKNGQQSGTLDAGKAALSGQEGTDQRSGDPPASERGFVYQLRRDCRTTAKKW